MGFADRYIHALGASNLKDDDLNHQAEPLLAAGLASSAAGDLGAMLHRAKYAGTAVANMAHAATARVRIEAELTQVMRQKEKAANREAALRQALEGDTTTQEAGVAHIANLLRVWTAEVIKRGRARRWVPENTAWDADAAYKLYRAVAENSLAYWLDDKCAPCGGTGQDSTKLCRVCSGADDGCGFRA
jgi:hypothetical protein